MDDAGNSRDDLTLPKGTDDAEKLARQIQEEFEAGKELTLTVLKVRNLELPRAGHFVCWPVWRGQERPTLFRLQAMGEEMISAVKSTAGS